MGKISKLSSNTMKRASSTLMVARNFKKTKRVSTNIESLPKELLTEILARVAASSLTDVFNAKLSCKTFHKAAEDTYVYRHVSLDDFPLVTWTPLSKKQQAFLAKCEECQNSEIMYRQGVVNFFRGKNIESGFRCLQNAINLKHTGATYATCIILLLSDNGEWKEQSIRELARMKKSKPKRRELKVHRDKLIDMLRSIWVEMPLIQRFPICCTRKHKPKKRIGWPNEEEEEEDLHCEACSADYEINFFREFFRRRPQISTQRTNSSWGPVIRLSHLAF